MVFYVFFDSCAMHGAAEIFNFIFEELLFDVLLNWRVLTEFVYCKLYVISILFFMFFLKGATDTYRFIFADLLFNILWKTKNSFRKLFCDIFFCNYAMHGAAEIFNSIFEKLIFGIFLNTNVLAEFIFYLILFEEYCEFEGREKLSFGEKILVNFCWWKSFFFFFWQVVRYFWLKVWWNLGRKQKCIFFNFIFGEI